MSHDHIDFVPQIPCLGSKGLFSPFCPLIVYFFLLHVKLMESHHTDFGPQIPFLGTGGLFLPFQFLKVYIFFIFIKFPIENIHEKKFVYTKL
jgi:hypothetical protein